MPCSISVALVPCLWFTGDYLTFAVGRSILPTIFLEGKQFSAYLVACHFHSDDDEQLFFPSRTLQRRKLLQRILGIMRGTNLLGSLGGRDLCASCNLWKVISVTCLFFYSHSLFFFLFIPSFFLFSLFCSTGLGSSVARWSAEHMPAGSNLGQGH